MNDRLIINADSVAVLQAATVSLTRRRLYPVRSFDLRSALASHPECGCPYHGTTDCTCQFVVLLIYGNATEPVALTLHSHEGRTAARIVRDATTAPDPQLSEEVMTGLLEAALVIQTTQAQHIPAELEAQG